MIIILNNLEDTAIFGQAFAEATIESPLTCLLFSGELGAGKTTITRAIVEALPQGSEAEISSPSFTICNVYQTNPRVFHYDLYRLPEGSSPDELEESMEEPGALNIVEWSEHLPARFMHSQHLRCSIKTSAGSDCRQITLQPCGKAAENFLTALEQRLKAKGLKTTREI